MSPFAARTLTIAVVLVSSFTMVPVAWPVDMAAPAEGLSRPTKNDSLCSRSPSPFTFTSTVPIVWCVAKARFPDAAA